MTLLKEFNQSYINYYVKHYALKMSKKADSRRVRTFENKCSDRSMKVKFSTFGGNNNRQTDQLTD